jgi:outer membrane protein TolC
MKTFLSFVGTATLLLWQTLDSQAQLSLSLEQAVQYALRNHGNVKTAQLDIENANARVNEIKAIGLPQVSGSVSYTNNLVVPRFFVPARTFDPNAPEGEVQAAKFGVNHSANAGIALSQLVFDGSYTLGLKAADVYKQLSVKSMTQTKLQLAEQVTKAYYMILVNDEQLKFLNSNVTRLDTLLRETRAYNQQGFVEKLDVQRLEVQVNNLKTTLNNVKRLQELSYQLLKFQMGMPQNELIVVSENLSQVDPTKAMLPTDASFAYENRIEYSLLQTQEKLAQLDIKNQRAGYLPSVRLNASYGYNTGRESFGDVFTKAWFGASAITLGIQIPIWDSYMRKNKVIQSENNLRKIKIGYQQLEQAIDFQRNQADISVKNAWQSLDENKKNMELAQEVIRVSRIKYQQGVGSSLEVLNAESAFREAQTNYFKSLYDALVAKVDWDKANGRLSVKE